MIAAQRPSQPAAAGSPWSTWGVRLPGGVPGAGYGGRRAGAARSPPPANSATSAGRKWAGPGDRQREGAQPGHAVQAEEDRAPIPDASRPGSSTHPSIGPPSPDAPSAERTDDGDPSSVLMATNSRSLPAPTPPAQRGARRLRRVTRTPRPPPSTMSGISGPSTTPKASVASAEVDTGRLDHVDGACRATVGGEAPPFPGDTGWRGQPAPPPPGPATATTPARWRTRGRAGGG